MIKEDDVVCKWSRIIIHPSAAVTCKDKGKDVSHRIRTHSTFAHHI